MIALLVTKSLGERKNAKWYFRQVPGDKVQFNATITQMYSPLTSGTTQFYDCSGLKFIMT